MKATRLNLEMAKVTHAYHRSPNYASPEIVAVTMRSMCLKTSEMFCLLDNVTFLVQTVLWTCSRCLVCWSYSVYDAGWIFSF